MLTAGQKTTLKAAILADNTLNSKPNTSDGNFEIAALLGAVASPSFWVWRTNVTRADIYNATSDVPSDFDWTIYKGQAVAEQNAWVQMFMGDQADFSKANLRAGIGKIFGASNANTLHCLAIGRRIATRIEKILATGTGTIASPAVMGFEGAISGDDVDAARRS